MKHILALFLGLGAIGVSSCNSSPVADVATSESFTMNITGMV